jgi:hypothetical protein
MLKGLKKCPVDTGTLQGPLYLLFCLLKYVSDFQSKVHRENKTILGSLPTSDCFRPWLLTLMTDHPLAGVHGQLGRLWLGWIQGTGFPKSRPERCEDG